jgi:acetyl-CoA C-acetyltransferase
MTIEPRTPVLVGVGAVQQRLDAGGVEAAELMIQAVDRAAVDAGDRALPARATLIAIPRGTWGYRDPGRLVAERIGAQARTVVAQVGVLQQTLITRVCAAIARGELDVAIVCGGEARYRERQAARSGLPVNETGQPGVDPDELLVPEGEILASLEIQRGLALPAHQYAIMENALRAADGQSLTDHAQAIAALWASFSAVGARNPDAWQQREFTPSSLLEESAANRSIAFPYRRLNISQWTVDQAAALIFASARAAQDLHLGPDRWLFPLAAAESNAMIPLSQRAQLDRCPGAKAAGAAVYSLAGLAPDDIAHVDLYSCFPAAVRMQARELGISAREPHRFTVTGGMTFAGGPFNNYVLQATARMAEVLRGDPGSVGIVTAISGMMTKQAVAAWSTEPPTQGFRWADVSDAVAAAGRKPLLADADGPATIAGYTAVTTERDPSLALVIADLPGGSRTVAVSDDMTLVRAMCQEEWSFRPIRVKDGRFLPT